MTEALSQAIEALLARWRSGLRAQARRHGVPAEDLDDVEQQVRIRIWRAVGEAERIRRLPASYVYRTLRAVVIDRMRRRRARGRLDTVELDEAPAEVLMRRDPDPVERDEEAEALERALATITMSRRGVVRMYLDGYSQREIGELLGWSEPKTRNLLYRGLAELRQLLELERTQ
jgi:RNA polymerase sigma-70 factor (ECF subfamily)